MAQRILSVFLVVLASGFPAQALPGMMGGHGGGMSGGSMGGMPMGGGNGFVSKHFSASDNCRMCHDNIHDAAGQDVSIVTDWSATMMANSTRDPFWKAKVRSELLRNPLYADEINDKCSVCHAPMANFEANYNGEPVEILDLGFLNPSHPRHAAAMDGVSCTLCHQISDSPNLGTPEGASGHYEIETFSTQVSRKLYGQYTRPFTRPMQMNVGYTPTHSLHIHESEVCATCHDLRTPVIDETGNLTSAEFPEQMPYSEWLHSSYNGDKSCQDCHMRKVNGVRISRMPWWLSARNDFSIHEFVGANKLMLGILQDNRAELGVKADDFQSILAATGDLLAESSKLSVQKSVFYPNYGFMYFGLKVESLTGHKLPSGYPSRRVILHVTVRNSAGDIVFESGHLNPDGSVEGADGDLDPGRFEPHHYYITSPDQVQIYEAIMGDSLGTPTQTLLEASSYLKDNRLLPRGFDKQTAPEEIAVQGAARNDSDFQGGSDLVHYVITNLPADVYQVDAELVYQTVSHAYIQDLAQDNSQEAATFLRMYELSPEKYSVLSSIRFAVQSQ